MLQSAQLDAMKNNMFEFDVKPNKRIARLVLKPLLCFLDKSFQHITRTLIKAHLDDLLLESDDEKLTKRVVALVYEALLKRELSKHFRGNKIKAMINITTTH